MSHFTKLDKANIISKDDFVIACEELGFTNIDFNTSLKGYQGNTMKADVVVHVGNYGFGLIKNGNKYDLIADWWGLRVNPNDLPEKFKQVLGMGVLSDEGIQNTILKHTTKHTIINKYKRLGYRANIKEENNEIQVELIKY